MRALPFAIKFIGEISMSFEVLVTCFLSSAVGVAVVTGIKELILWKLNRDATVEDREDAKEEKNEETAVALADHIEEANTHNKEVLETLKELKESLNNHISDDITIERALYKHTIRSLCIEYLQAEEIDIDDKRILMELWSVYHNELNGNGYFDELMKSINELPVIVAQ